jgi:hypothetical protein
MRRPRPPRGCQAIEKKVIPYLLIICHTMKVYGEDGNYRSVYS